MWGKLTERSDRTQSRVITEPKELYNFMFLPGIEVTKKAFNKDDVVWISWKHSAEEHVPKLRHTNEVIGAYVTSGAGCICIAISTGWERESIYCGPDTIIYIQPKDELNLIETWEIIGKHDLRTTDHRLHIRICEWWPQELRIQSNCYRDRSGDYSLQSSRDNPKLQC